MEEAAKHYMTKVGMKRIYWTAMHQTEYFVTGESARHHTVLSNTAVVAEIENQMEVVGKR